MITLRQLRYFCALARHRHFGRAAEECAVSQPALSVQIRELEDFLGARLVERRRNGIALTALGAAVEVRAAAVLNDAAALVDFARHGQAVLSGPLRLGVIPTIAPYLLPILLPRLPQGYPALELSLREAQTETLLEALAAGTLDAVLLSLPIAASGFETLDLFEDRFLLALPPATPMPVNPKPSSLANEQVLLLEDGHCLRDQALALCQLADARARRQYGAASLTTLVQMVAGGFGCTLVPEIAVPTELRAPAPVRLIRFTAPEPSRRIGLVWRVTSGRARDFAALGDMVRAAGVVLRDRAAATLRPIGTEHDGDHAKGHA